MSRGFFESLFDLSFTSFVTTKLIKILFIFYLAFVALGYIVYLAVAFAADPTVGVLWMFIGGPIWAFFSVLLARVFCELVMVIFRIFETLRDQLALQQALNPDAAQAGASGASPAVTEVIPASVPPAQTALTCPSCSSSISPTDKFCESCGAAL